MKQLLLKATLLFTLSSALLASCSKNKSNDVIETTVSQPLLMVVTEKEDADSWSKFTYNTQRRLTEVTYKTRKTVYVYANNKLELKLYKTGSETPYGSYSGELNANGTLKNLTGSRKSGNGTYNSAYSFTYDNNNQLIQLTENAQYDNGPVINYKMDYTWENGNCVKMTLWNNGAIQNQRTIEYDLTKENKLQMNGKGFMEWTDAYLLGRTNKNIEKSILWKNADGTTASDLVFTWTFDANALPVQCEIKNKLNGTFFTEVYQFK